MKLHNLDNVEIFRTGTWKGREFTERDLDDIVANFERFRDTWFKPAIKDGHHQDIGKPALGYVSRLWRKGKKLVADLVELPAKVFDAIKAHGYDRVSIELAPLVERDGKKHKNVLWALSILGVEVPEVDGLKPLRDSLAYSEEVDVVDLTTFLNIEGETFTVWPPAFIEQLPDHAFALVTKDKTSQEKKRHLPHHSSKVADPGDNDTVDKAHLLHELSRLDGAELSDEEKVVAYNHLVAHAEALGLDVGSFARPEPDKEDSNMDADAKKKLEEQIAKLTSDLEAATKKIETMSADKDPKVETLMEQIETMSAELKQSKEKIQHFETNGRMERIKAKVEKLRLPALRPFVKEFYELATGASEPIKFSADATDPKEVTQEQVVDQFVEKLNAASENLFTSTTTEQTFKRDDVVAPENVRDQVDAEVKKYMTENKTDDYGAAMVAVFEQNHELRDKYNAVSQ